MQPSAAAAVQRVLYIHLVRGGAGPRNVLLMSGAKGEHQHATYAYFPMWRARIDVEMTSLGFIHKLWSNSDDDDQDRRGGGIWRATAGGGEVW